MVPAIPGTPQSGGENFKTLTLFSITKNKKYELKQGEKGVDLQDYLKDVFSSYYSEFLLNFGMEDLISTMAD